MFVGMVAEQQYIAAAAENSCSSHPGPAPSSRVPKPHISYSSRACIQMAPLSGSVSVLKRLVETHLREKEQAAELLKGYVTTITREVREFLY